VQGRQADRPVAEPFGVQPVLVEIQACRHDVGDALVKARHKDPANSRFGHFLLRLRTLVDAAILAGGRARRFGGRDKSSLHVGGASILERQLAALDGVAGRILVVSAHPARYQERGLEAVADLVPGAASLGGIYTALARATGSHVLVVACDLPFLTASFLRRLVALARPEDDAVVPRTADGWQPLCAVYSRRLAEPARRQIEAGRLKIVEFLAAARVREIGPDAIAEDDPDGLLFFNVNSFADWQLANQLAASRGR
jgi:molybdopterin-guanine dinucleotide biosynthesis protein A